MKYVFLIFLSFFIIKESYSQNKLDSLKNIWNNSTEVDTTRLKAVKDITWHFMDINLDSAINYANIRYSYAKEKNIDQHITGSLNSLGIAYKKKKNYEKSIEYLEQALALNKKIDNKSGIDYGYSNLGEVYSVVERYDEAINNLSKSLEYRLTQKSQRDIAVAHYNLGKVYLAKKEYDSAISNYEKSAKIFDELKSTRAVVQLYNEIGEIYTLQNNFKNAYLYYEKALKINEAENNQKSISYSLFQIGSALMLEKKDSLAIDYYNRCLHIDSSLKEWDNVKVDFVRLANIYKNLGDYDNTIYYLNKKLIVYDTLGDKKNSIKTLNEIASIYNNQKKYEDEIEIYNRSIKINKEIKDGYGVSYGNFMKAAAYYSIGNLDSALQLYSKCRSFYIEEKSKKNEVVVLLRIINLYKDQKMYDTALTYSFERLALFKELDDKNEIAKATKEIGNLFNSQMQYKKANEQYAAAVLLYIELKDKSNTSSCYSKMAKCYEHLFLYQESINFHEKSLEIDLSLGDLDDVAWTLGQIGTIYKYLGDYKKSIEYLNQCLEIRKKLQQPEEVAGVLHDLGVIQTSLDNYILAEKLFNESIEYYKSKNSKKDISLVLTNLGNTYYAQGNYNKAIEVLAESFLIKKEINDVEGMAYNQYSTGQNFLAIGEYSKALEYFNHGKNLFIEVNNPLGVITSNAAIGIVYFGQGNYNKAKEFHEINIETQSKINDKVGLANSYINLGSAYAGLKDSVKLFDNYLKGVTIFRENENKGSLAMALSNLGYLYFHNNDSINALLILTEGLEIAEEINAKATIANILNKLGEVYFSNKNYNKAAKYYYDSYLLSKEMGANNQIRNALKNLINYYIDLKNYDSAFVYVHELNSLRENDMKINFEVLSEKEKEMYFDVVSTDYRLISKFADLSKTSHPSITEIAYNNALRIKGLRLKSSASMKNAILSSGDTSLISKYQYWMEIKRKIAKLESKGEQSDSLIEKSEAIEKQLIQNSKEFSEEQNVKNLTWKNIKEKLKPNEAAIEFVYYSADTSMYAALLVKHNSKYPEMITLCSSKQLENTLKKNQLDDLNYIQNLYGTKSNFKNNLYELVWKPIDENLNGIKKVYLSPTRQLNKISFYALKIDSANYLNNRYDLQILSSTGNIINKLNHELPKKNTLAIFGGIDYNSSITKEEIWNYLPGTLTETESISDILNNKKYQVNYFKGTDATESAFKLNYKSNNLIHVATHGFLFPDPEDTKNNSEPSEKIIAEVKFRGTNTVNGVWNFVNNKNPLMRSGLVMAGANDVIDREVSSTNEDGLLTAQEISNLDMRHIDLAVMSACETGLGDIKGSEGVYGLQRGFKIAGVKYIIMSLWQVPDNETSEFMTLFYTHLSELKDIQKAFQKTQNVMSKKYDPFYWAAFVLLN